MGVKPTMEPIRRREDKRLQRIWDRKVAKQKLETTQAILALLKRRGA